MCQSILLNSGIRATRRLKVSGFLPQVMSCPSGFLEKFRDLQSFRLHTGNINAYNELKLKRFASSAEELSACLKIQLASTPAATDFRNNGTLLLCDNSHIDKYERDDLKITMKLFLSRWCEKELKEAVDALKDQLATTSIELLIVAFPELEIVDGESEEEENKRWIKHVLPLWTSLEELIKSGEVVSLGVSDLSLNQLQTLCDEVDTRPTVDHLRIDGCCVVPPELQEYAKNHDVQLLTHNDPIPFPTREVFHSFCTLNEETPLCSDLFEPTWTVRYTVWVRRRSVMASKGYIVAFVGTQHNKE
ncbi:hypothetical protein PRIPAC_88436 [Pristionchus pacificus]|uniref:GCS light chain n=1 Tax=Pristionchus pacificus TaxID=54126 RepID=A0A2A6CZI7_PRIPA|nr:hypothetical protein PRIPAC_88436 [Pristionchus pacificus]|eukprot:PDM83443.1 hypothetical protein PRIPAC_35075 [Pristionchus pacificus]